ncbi:MAG: preprotein translocase subunit YajC [bacterium]
MNYLIAMGAPGQSGGGSMVQTLIMFGAIFAIFYFMIIRPQQKRAKEREALLSAIQKGDKVITSGGVHGVIAGLEDKTVLLDLGNNVKIKVERSAITTVVKEGK